VSTPAGAEVTRDGARIGVTPLELKLPRGSEPVELVVQKDGYLTARRSLVPDENRQIAIKLLPKPVEDGAEKEPDATPPPSKEPPPKEASPKSPPAKSPPVKPVAEVEPKSKPKPDEKATAPKPDDKSKKTHHHHQKKTDDRLLLSPTF
jgi:hypothetical protein